jgi:glutamate mutase epsilon subunit
MGFIISVILSTGISHWFYLRRLEMARRNRAMVVSFYFFSPLGWVWVPCAAGAVVLAIPPLASTSQALGDLAMLSVLVCELSSLALVLAMLNSIRAADAAAHCGFVRSVVVAVGIVLQAAVSCVIGLGLFPAVVGLFRLMITSLWR